MRAPFRDEASSTSSLRVDARPVDVAVPGLEALLIADGRVREASSFTGGAGAAGSSGASMPNGPSGPMESSRLSRVVDCARLPCRRCGRVFESAGLAAVLDAGEAGSCVGLDVCSSSSAAALGRLWLECDREGTSDMNCQYIKTLTYEWNDTYHPTASLLHPLRSRDCCWSLSYWPSQKFKAAPNSSFGARLGLFRMRNGALSTRRSNSLFFALPRTRTGIAAELSGARSSMESLEWSTPPSCAEPRLISTEQVTNLGYQLWRCQTINFIIYPVRSMH